MKNVLVTYATKVGSTYGVAERIANTLAQEGFKVTLRLVTEVPDVSIYDAVVVGSAIRVGKWLPPAVKFIENNVADLVKMPVVFFTVCMTLQDDTPEHRQEVYAYTDPIRRILTPQAEGFFAGAMDYKELSFPVRLLVRGIGVPEGDFRNWDVIESWAQTLTPVLMEEPEGIR